MRSFIIHIALVFTFSSFLFPQDSAPQWHTEWANDTIHLKAEQYFWVPNDTRVDDVFVSEIRSLSKHMAAINKKYSFQEFICTNIKWVSLVNDSGKTDPIYMIKQNGNWKIVLDKYRENISFPDEGIKVLMKKMFDSLERQNLEYIKSYK